MGVAKMWMCLRHPDSATKKRRFTFWGYSGWEGSGAVALGKWLLGFTWTGFEWQPDQEWKEWEHRTADGPRNPHFL